MEITLQLIPHNYFGFAHVAEDVKEMLKVIYELEKRGIVERIPSGHDFMIQVNIEIDGDVQVMWSFQDTTGISGLVDKDLLQYACEKAGVPLKINVKKPRKTH